MLFFHLRKVWKEQDNTYSSKLSGKNFNHQSSQNKFVLSKDNFVFKIYSCIINIYLFVYIPVFLKIFFTFPHIKMTNNICHPLVWWRIQMGEWQYLSPIDLIKYLPVAHAQNHWLSWLGYSKHWCIPQLATQQWEVDDFFHLQPHSRVCERWDCGCWGRSGQGAAIHRTNHPHWCVSQEQGSKLFHQQQQLKPSPPPPLSIITTTSTVVCHHYCPDLHPFYVDVYIREVASQRLWCFPPSNELKSSEVLHPCKSCPVRLAFLCLSIQVKNHLLWVLHNENMYGAVARMWNGVFLGEGLGKISLHRWWLRRSLGPSCLSLM